MELDGQNSVTCSSAHLCTRGGAAASQLPRKQAVGNADLPSSAGVGPNLPERIVPPYTHGFRGIGSVALSLRHTLTEEHGRSRLLCVLCTMRREPCAEGPGDASGELEEMPPSAWKGAGSRGLRVRWCGQFRYISEGVPATPKWNCNSHYPRRHGLRRRRALAT